MGIGLGLTPLIFRSKKLAKMVRNNQKAPLPPSCGKDCSDDTLSLLIMFDDLKRNGKVSNILYQQSKVNDKCFLFRFLVMVQGRRSSCSLL